MPPYAPPTEHEWTEFHRRLSWYIDAYERLVRALDPHGAAFTDPAYHDDMVARATTMTKRLECLRIAVAS